MKTQYGTYAGLVDTAGRKVSKVFYRFRYKSGSCRTGKPHQSTRECSRRVRQGMHLKNL